MEQVLRSLYKVQQIDLELDELAAGSGDLPADIGRLEVGLEEVATELSETEKALAELRIERSQGNLELTELREKAHELNERLRSVRNNKEYDATTNDIASAEQRENDLTSILAGLDTKEANLVKQTDTQEKRQVELTEMLADKKETLETIESGNAEELTSLTAMRKSTVPTIPEALLSEYLTIRERYDEAVVRTRKGACAGCYRAITPQTLVELRRNEQLFHCEHCGRVIVDEELAQAVTVLE